MRKIFWGLLWLCIGLSVMVMTSASASAQTYRWDSTGVGTVAFSPAATSPDPWSTCTAAAAAANAKQTSNTYTFTGNIAFSSETAGVCSYTWKSNSSTATGTQTGSVQRFGSTCPAGQTYSTVTRSCVEPCPQGTQRYCDSVCRTIPSDTCTVDSCGMPTGKHNWWNGEINQCVDDCGPGEEQLPSGLCVPEQVCPAGTFKVSAPGQPLKCSPTDPNQPPKKTCGPGEITLGFDGQGNAICGVKPPEPDPCPPGTKNVSADPGDPNCLGYGPDTASPPKTDTTTNTPETTTSNPDGSTTKSSTETTTHSDGSTSTTTTTTTTHADGTVTTSRTTTNTGGEAAKGSGGSAVGDGVTGVKGDLYAKKDKTFASALESFNSTVNNAPFMSAAKSFFTVSVNAAGCPSWTVTIDMLAASFNLGDYFCAPGVAAMFDIGAIALLIAAAYVAFRVAFL